jgi:rubrerythrin
MIIDLINNSTFDPKNPFDINVNIFPNMRGSRGDQVLYDLLLQHWIWVWEAELHTALIYQGVLENVKLGKYNYYLQDLSAEDLQLFCDYFAIAVEEEFEHKIEMEAFLEKVYPGIIQTLDTDDYLTRITAEVELELRNDLVAILLKYFFGECYHWCVFYSFYGQTTEQNKKDIIHKFMIEEASHHNNVFKLLQKISNRINVDHDTTIESIRRKRYFAYDWIEEKYNISTTESLLKDQVGIKLFFNTPWQQEFNHEVLRKIYRVYDLLWPGKTLEEFKNLVNYT